MRYILALAIAIFVVAGLHRAGLRHAGVTAMTTQEMPARSSASAPTRTGNGTAYVRLDRNNAFTTDIEIEGMAFRGLIDTGAGSVVVRYEDAQRLGLFRHGYNWSQTVRTANGSGKAMAVRLNNVSIGDLTVYGV